MTFVCSFFYGKNVRHFASVDNITCNKLFIPKEASAILFRRNENENKYISKNRIMSDKIVKNIFTDKDFHRLCE